MSKITNYSEARKRINAQNLVILFNTAIANDDVFLLIQAQQYGSGLQDAYETILDQEESDNIETIISQKSEEFMTRTGGHKNWAPI